MWEPKMLDIVDTKNALKHRENKLLDFESVYICGWTISLKSRPLYRKNSIVKQIQHMLLTY